MLTMPRFAAACSAALCLLALGSSAAVAHADTFSATYLAAGVQTPTGITSTYETFNNATKGSNTGLTTTFNGSSITGTYSGNYTISSANQYGGAGGTGNYIYAAQNSSYTLSLSSNVNYFGLWFSALDLGNQLSFYENSTLLYTFTPAAYIALVGSCPSASNAYCGNPNTTDLNQDAAQQYAYLNFYDQTGSFNKVVFTEINNAGQFESDNQAVAVVNGPTVGTPINVTPEPSSLALFGTGVLGIAGTLRRRLA